MTIKQDIVILFFLFSSVVLLSNAGAHATPVTNVSNNNQTGKEVISNYVEKGLELYNASNYEQAVQWFDKALAVDPNYTAAVVNKARAYYNLDKLPEALQIGRAHV